MPAVVESKAAVAVIKKQKDTGVWGGNLLGLAASAAQGIKDVGTIPQYRRLLQLGWPRASRPFKLGDRVLFRLLSRDEDPALLFEFQKMVKSDVEAEAWARGIMREAASAALAEAGYAEDPRLRGAGHKIANAISQFLRSPLAEKPFLKAGKQIVLHPEAHPPSWYSVAMLSFMPNLQRERAGFTERLGHYLAQPAPKKSFVIQVGKRTRQAAAPAPGRPHRDRRQGPPHRPAARAALHRADGADGRSALGAGGLQGTGTAAEGHRRARASGGPRTCGRSRRPSTRSPTTITRCWRMPRRPKGARWTSRSGWRSSPSSWAGLPSTTERPGPPHPLRARA